MERINEPIRPVEFYPVGNRGPTSTRAPLSLRIVAYFFILIGTLGVTEMALQLLVFHVLYIDWISILAIFTGRGLLRWNESWRKAAILFSSIFLIFAVILIGIVLADVLLELDWQERAKLLGSPLGSGATILTGVALALYSAWQIHVLRRPDIVRQSEVLELVPERKDGGKFPTEPLRWRFSLGSLFLMMFVATFVVARITAKDVFYETHHITGSRAEGNSTCVLEYGVRTSRVFDRPNELIYVVISSGIHHHHASGHVVSSSSSKRSETWLISEEGQRKLLPSINQLYEIIDGKIHTREERVTRAEFDDFIDSSPSERSLDALVRHAEQMRERRTNLDDSENL